MSKEDIEKAVKEAEQYAAEDAKIKEKVEVRNQADQMVYQAEKTLNEVGDKVPESEKEPMPRRCREAEGDAEGRGHRCHQGGHRGADPAVLQDEREAVPAAGASG